MGRKSTRENKNVYQTSREAAGLTREAASEAMEYISSDRIEKIEYETSLPQPEEVLAMADAYKNPGLCNYYCSHECPIGREYVPEVQVKDLAVVTLEMLSLLNKLNKDRDILIDIVADGEISRDEYADFAAIQTNLEKMSLAIDSLKLWVDHTIAAGKIDASFLNA